MNPLKPITEPVLVALWKDVLAGGEDIPVYLKPGSLVFTATLHKHEFTADTLSGLYDKLDASAARRHAETKVKEAGVEVGVVMPRVRGKWQYVPNEPHNVILRRPKEGGARWADAKILAADAVTKKPLPEPLQGRQEAYLPWTPESALRFETLRKAAEEAEKEGQLEVIDNTVITTEPVS